MKKLFLSLFAALVLVAAVFIGYIGWTFTAISVDTVGKVDFDRELAIPELADSTVNADGERVFDLTLQRGTHDFGRGKTATWGVNGDYLGPTLRAERGERVRVNVKNELGESSSLHWHGMHLPAVMDGGPHQMIEDDATWSPHWTIDQPAASLWYHPHPHGRTAEHVYRGVSGLFLIDDDVEAELPDRYGVDDIPLIVQDKKFDDEGQLSSGSNFLTNVGVLGDTIAVNGTVGPRFGVTAEMTRFRVLNGSNSRIFNFAFDDERAFHLIGTDGGLVERPVELRNLQLTPGERAEIVVRMEPGESTVLRSEKAVTNSNRLNGTESRFDVLRLDAAEALSEAPPLPDPLVDVPLLDEADATVTRSFSLADFKINGRAMDMNRIDATVDVGDTEIWEVRNADDGVHNFHVHDVQFQVLSIGGDQPPEWLLGWKDTVPLPPNKQVRLVMRFTNYTDPEMPYMFHCHILRHEDEGMMGQFVVVEPGESAGTPPDHGDHH